MAQTVHLIKSQFWYSNTAYQKECHIQSSMVIHCTNLEGSKFPEVHLIGLYHGSSLSGSKYDLEIIDRTDCVMLDPSILSK